MKKFLMIIMMISLLITAASAETVVDGVSPRNIAVQPAQDNPVQDGISPTTGRALSGIEVPEGFRGLAAGDRYLPMLVQIDNTDGGVGYRAPRGAEYADVIYETPLYRTGETRLTYLFSDLIPTVVGPVRSARIFHAYLRDEWNCSFVHYGQQEYEGADVKQYFDDEGILNGTTVHGVLFNGTDGDAKPYKKYFWAEAGLMEPHDKFADTASLFSMIAENLQPTNHTWLFADKLPDYGDEATMIHVNWAARENGLNSLIEWNEDEEVYERYMINTKGREQLYIGYDTQEAITFSNVIVQFMHFEFPGKTVPIPTVLGTGNADIFIGGMHMQGVWQRENMNSRTVFYDESGLEIELQPGRTLIIVLDADTVGRSLSYE